MRYGIGIVPTEQLDLSRSPIAELASGAIEARQASGDEHPAFIIVAIPAGEIPKANEAIKRALDE